MITAEEARKQSKKFEVKGLTAKKMIESAIREAVIRGVDSCWINFHISDDTYYWLQSLGYKVKRINSTIPNNHFAKIMW